MSKPLKAITGDFAAQVRDRLIERYAVYFKHLTKENQRDTLIELLKYHFKGSKKLEKDIEELCREAIIAKIVE